MSAGGGVMLVGAMIAGGVATKRSVEPSGVGLRAGFLGSVLAVSVFLITDAMTVIDWLTTYEGILRLQPWENVNDSLACSVRDLST